MEESIMSARQELEKRTRPQVDEALKCPRCDSTNTKFCYYNNYSLSQPRYFCKGCRRYWTKGGTLRNVPIGGGCRKNKRSSTSKRAQDQALVPAHNPVHHLLPSMAYDSRDLALALARFQSQSNADLAVGIHPTAASLFNNICYDNGGYWDGEGSGVCEQMMGPYEAVTVTAMKQDACEERMTWGLPWQQVNGGGNNGIGDFDWSGVNSTWHGIVNTALI